MAQNLALPAESARDALAPPPIVREAVRSLLLSAASYHQLPDDERLQAAQSLVKVCHTAVALLGEVARSEQLVAETKLPRSAALPLAFAQNAGSEFSGVSAQRVAGTTSAILNAVSFPRFVTELITGVFKAMVDSNQQQMQAYVELIRNVAATTEGFADMNFAPDRARAWLVETFPGSFALEGGPDEDSDPRDAAEEQAEARVVLRSGAAMPSEAALRSALGIEPNESVPSGDPETAFLPYARRALARQRQQMLATMVMLGMQRIVIESGRLNASMRFHIDTRSAANAEQGSRFDFQNQIDASGKFGVGPWGLEAKMTNTIGYVSTQKTQSSEEMNTDLDLNSSVELYFKTDYVPLDRLAGKGQVDRIKVNTLNPDAEEDASRKAREARTADARKAEVQRGGALDGNLQHARSTPRADPAPPSKTAESATKPAPKAKAPVPKDGAAKKQPPAKGLPRAGGKPP